MDAETDPRDPVAEGVELSRRRLRDWPLWQQHAYAAVVSAMWVAVIVAAVVVTVLLARDGFPSPVLTALLVWVGIFALVVSSWMLWNLALPLYADLATDGRYSVWRAARLRRFDRAFSWIAFVMLLSIVLLPALQLLE